MLPSEWKGGGGAEELTADDSNFRAKCLNLWTKNTCSNLKNLSFVHSKKRAFHAGFCPLSCRLVGPALVV